MTRAEQRNARLANAVLANGSDNRVVVARQSAIFFVWNWLEWTRVADDRSRKYTTNTGGFCVRHNQVTVAKLLLLPVLVDFYSRFVFQMLKILTCAVVFVCFKHFHMKSVYLFKCKTIL